MKLYVAGPMTGLDDYNLPAFADAARQLEGAGFEAVNPGRHGVLDGYTWSDYMRRGIAELVTCDGVALLEDWWESRGASVEKDLAEELGMTVKPVEEWLTWPTI